jgi:hypothetical protein
MVIGRPLPWPPAAVTTTPLLAGAVPGAAEVP